MVILLPDLPTCMFCSVLCCGLGSSSKFNAKVKQSDYVLGSIKVACCHFFHHTQQMDTHTHTINTTKNVWDTIKWTQIWYPYHELHALTKLTNIISERIYNIISKCMHDGSVSNVRSAAAVAFAATSVTTAAAQPLLLALLLLL